jgi:ABC-2 type transport system permease protein
MQAAAEILPFRWMIGFPVELILGRMTIGETCLGLLIQSAWIGLAFLLLRAVWRAGLRVYSAVGA